MDSVVLGKHIGVLTWATAGALLTAEVTPSLPSDYIPIYAELTCWLFVLAVFEAAARLSKGGLQTNSANHRWMPWIAATSITVAALCSSAEDITWLFPAITPVLILLRQGTLLPSLHQTYPKFIHSILAQAGVGAASILALAPRVEYTRLPFPLLAVFAYLLLLLTFIRMFEVDVDLGTTAVRQELGDSVKIIACRAIALLVVPSIATLFLLSSSSGSLIWNTLWAGFTKGIHWATLFWITQEVPWEVATTIWTCAAASKYTFTATAPASLGLIQAFSRVTVGFVAIIQTIAFLPKHTAGRYLLVLFGIWPMVALLNLPSPQGGIWTGNKPRPGPHHPIEELITKAQTDFVQLIERQSKTLEQAESEYRRRYTRDPPPGFDKWFAYAREHSSVFIDDFDMINEDMKPFWKISPQRLLESIDHVTQNDGLALRKCGFANGEYYRQGDGWIIEDYGGLLQDVAHNIPDVQFAFDVVDEPREIITQSMLESGGVRDPQFQNANHKSIWSQVIGPCGNSSKSYESTIYDYDIPFIQDWSEAKDVCQHPEYEHMHGFFASPETCILTDAPVPIISQAAPSSFTDILYPSPWYTAKYAQGVYQDEDDPPWDKKINNLYWAGSTTGSRSTGGSWKYSHRQRFVKLVQTINETSHKYLREAKSGSSWESYTAKEDLSNLFNVKLTAIIQCDDPDCEEQKQFFEIGEREERSAQFHSRFIFDADGNAFSGRYYTLLQSRSVVLKQTVLREWHDERLIPWIHFIPISLSMEELPEIMKYMTSYPGQERAREIADASREWQGKVLRREDFTIYLYRLMLELGRIMDPKRKVE